MMTMIFPKKGDFYLGKLEPLDQPWGSLLPDLLWEIVKPPINLAILE